MAIRKPRTYAETLEALRKSRDAIKKLDERKGAESARRDELIGHAAGFPEAQGGMIAKSAGVVASRVSQIAPVRKSKLQSSIATAEAIAAAPRHAVRAARAAGVIGSTTEPAEHTSSSAPKKLTGAAARIADALGGELPGATEYVTELQAATVPAARQARVLPGIGDTPITIEHGSVSKRKWTPQKSRFLACATADGRMYAAGRWHEVPLRDRSAGAWLEVLPPSVERLVIVGDAPWHTDRDTTMTYDVTEWLSAPLPEGWAAESHFPHERHPVARFVTTSGTRRRVEIQHLGSWVPGSSVDDPAVAWDAFDLMRDALRARFSDAVELLTSPKTLGEDLWQRTIPKGTEYPLMSEELRQLIKTTSGQGRVELFAPHDGAEKLPELHYYDCTFAYAGLTWGFPVGEPTRITAREYESATAESKAKMVRGRGRWHVRATVPADWHHVGLLPLSGVGGWEYPREPGRTFETWASGPEIWVALQNGWHLDVIDGITWREGKPLDLWRNKLVAAWESLAAQAATGGKRDAAALASKMVRSILLFTIGGFHSAGVQRKGIAPSMEQIPAGARPVSEHNGSWSWRADATGSGGNNAHPEWSAETYGRMRARLLTGPGGTGALSVPFESVLAFRSDAMMLTVNTGWANPNKQPGRFRLKGSLGECLAPRTEGELLALRDAAEDSA